jgi:DNA-binding transcriptional LysR family regulator
MRTDFIRTALKEAELGQLEQAAKEMFVTLHVARYRVQILEIELGFALFAVPNDYRHGGVVPTERGAKWLAFARKALEMLDAGAVPVDIKRADKVKTRTIRRKAG